MKAKLYQVPTDLYSAIVVVEHDGIQHITGDVDPLWKTFNISDLTVGHLQHNIDCKTLISDSVHEEIEIHCSLLNSRLSPAGIIKTFQYTKS